MTWASRSKRIAVGDMVRYSAEWLRSTGTYTGDLPHARGTVKELKTLSPEVILATIDWDLPDIPPRVNVKNLQRCNQKGHTP